MFQEKEKLPKKERVWSRSRKGLLKWFCGAGVRAADKKFETLTKTPKKYIFLYPQRGIDY
jgi:hypothetical protein